MSIRVFDLHCDTLDRLELAGTSEYALDNPEKMQSLSSNECHVNLNHLAEHAYVQCFAIFIPDSYKGIDAVAFYEKVHTRFLKELSLHTKTLAQAHSGSDIMPLINDKKTVALLTVEGGSVLGSQIARVPLLAKQGVKMITLTWNGKNALGSGNNTTDGLTTFGREAIRALEEHKIVVDVSHLNDAGFADLLDVVSRPFAASHSNLRSVHAHMRNLTDYQFQAICDHGGIVGLNFCKQFISDTQDPSFDDLSYHIDGFLKLGGEDHIALGADYDGASVPSWLEPSSQLIKLYKLISNRFGTSLANKLFFDNAHSFFVRNDA